MNPNEAHQLVDTRDGIGVLTMNRPERLNALSQQMIDSAIDTLERIATDPAVSCIVPTGAGRGFCAGGDVKAVGGSAVHDMSLEQQVDRQRRVQRMSALLHDSAKVSIAAINGPCAGAGFGLALACDLRLAADTATFTTAFAKVGFAGEFGITWALARARRGAREGVAVPFRRAYGATGRGPGPAEPRAAAGRADACDAAAGRAHRRRAAS
jgi:2-(1,2-epoxy-1,2-dihydrophenyl)acetyl-CoA isomerase